MSCIVEGCENNKIVAKSMCSKHYNRQHRYGNTSFVKQNKTPPETCVCEGCDRKPKAKSLCEAHYARFTRDGETFNRGPVRQVRTYLDNDICIMPRCNEKPFGIGMCRKHYQQQHKHKLDFSKILHLFEVGCKTCGSLKNLSIDHDYSICKDSFACDVCFRGILCGPCKRALGIVKDSTDILKNMILYIQK
jgi:hypothetical protein